MYTTSDATLWVSHGWVWTSLGLLTCGMGAPLPGYRADPLPRVLLCRGAWRRVPPCSSPSGLSQPGGFCSGPGSPSPLASSGWALQVTCSGCNLWALFPFHLFPRQTVRGGLGMPEGWAPAPSVGTDTVSATLCGGVGPAERLETRAQAVGLWEWGSHWGCREGGSVAS